MCGIAGAAALRPGARPSAEAVRRMSLALQHRGPDGEGLWTSPDGRVILAHRRLSVIDLVTGGQPKTVEDGGGRLALVFNGEIYNYLELRAALERQGVRFTTQSDTEVLLRAFRHQGPSCLDDMRGMFAFAMWDEGEGTLWLARDRLGKKPLYLTEHEEVMYFSSSLDSLRAAIGRTPPIDAAAVDDFLTLGFIPAPRTIHEGIEKLPAATLLRLDARGRTTTTFWRPRAEADPVPMSLDELEAALDESVRLRLRSDVPLGVFLSGGVDSSLITALAARHVGGLRTFSIAFGEAGYDENEAATAVAAHLGTAHRSFVVREQLLEVLPGFLRQAGEPFADAAALPLMVLAREARQDVTVALGGDGGDEAFGGYPWYRLAKRLHRMGRMIPSVAAAPIARALRATAPTSTSGVRLARLGRALGVISAASPAERFALMRTFVHDDDAAAWYAPALRDARASHETALERIAEAYEDSGGPPLRRMRWADITVHLADWLLPKSDLATMAHGLELRAPLLDHTIVERGLAMPESRLIDARGGKAPLRALLGRQLPAALWDRPKQGFVVPLATWFRGGLRARIESLPRADVVREGRWLQPAAVTRLVDEHVRGARDHTQRLFNLVVLDEWTRQV